MQADTDVMLNWVETEFQKLSLQKQTELLQVLVNKFGLRLKESVTPDTLQVNTENKQRRVLGLHEGKGWISDDFDDELPDEFWGGRV